MECACARSERHLVVLPAGSSCSRRRSRGSRDFFCALPCVSTFPFPSLSVFPCHATTAHRRCHCRLLSLAPTRFLFWTVPHHTLTLTRTLTRTHACIRTRTYSHTHTHGTMHVQCMYNAQRITLSGRLLPLERSGTFGSKSRWSMNMP